MKKTICLASLIACFGLLPAIASASVTNSAEVLKVAVEMRKIDPSVPAHERFEMFDRLAERKCETTGKSLEALKFKRACKVELKRSVISQIGDAALRDYAKKQGVL